MYVVRNSSGKVVARFETKAQAEACVRRRTAKSPVPEGMWRVVAHKNGERNEIGKFPHDENAAKRVAVAHARQGYRVELFNDDFLVDVYPPSRPRGRGAKSPVLRGAARKRFLDVKLRAISHLLQGKRLEVERPDRHLVLYMGVSKVNRPDPFWYEHPGGRTYKTTPEEVVETVINHVGLDAVDHAKVYEH